MQSKHADLLIFSGVDAGRRVIEAAVNARRPHDSFACPVIFVPPGTEGDWAREHLDYAELSVERGKDVLVDNGSKNGHIALAPTRPQADMSEVLTGIIKATRIGISDLAEILWDHSTRGLTLAISCEPQFEHGLRHWVRPFLDPDGTIADGLNGTVQTVKIAEDGTVSDTAPPFSIRYEHTGVASVDYVTKLAWQSQSELVEFDGGWCYAGESAVDLRAITGIAVKRDSVAVQLPRGYVSFATNPNDPADARSLARRMMQEHRALDRD